MLCRLVTRRAFLKTMAAAGGLFNAQLETLERPSVPCGRGNANGMLVCRAVNGTPTSNLRKVVEMMGGIEKLIGPDDVVVVKPNVQWWNQGASNLSALKAFVDLVMERLGGFRGEVVLAENCHRGPTPSTSRASGWARPFERNSDLAHATNMGGLCNLLKSEYGARFSVCHWIDVDAGGKRVHGPEEGEGYVYCDGTGGVPLISCNNGSSGKQHRATTMTYPVFATDRGTWVDLRNGVWERGAYTGQPLRFINFAALNHHSTYCGFTSAVKNHLGVVDLSGSPDPSSGGLLTQGYHNFHSFAFNKWSAGPVPGMLGREVGTFLGSVRKPDFSITTAEWVGLSSRVDPPVAHTRAVLGSTDPVALDYHAAKYVLHPNSKLRIHDPDHSAGPAGEYLSACAAEGAGSLDERQVEIRSYDLERKASQDGADLAIRGPKKWGASFDSIVKYLILRYFLG